MTSKEKICIYLNLGIEEERELEAGIDTNTDKKKKLTLV